MTENKPHEQGAEDENASYLYEAFVTDDGIEVPPPTRSMGPRRLARYRDDAAAYLRAMRNGDDVPEEPVPYMPSLDTAVGITPEVLAVQRRFNALASQGGIDTSWEHTASIFEQGGKDTRDDVAVPESSAEGFDPHLPAADYEPEETIAPSDVTVSGDIVTEEDLAQAAQDRQAMQQTQVQAQVYADPKSQTLAATSSDFAESRTGLDQGERGLPEPVRALDAQGLDLAGIETEIEPVDGDEDEGYPQSASTSYHFGPVRPSLQQDSDQQGQWQDISAASDAYDTSDYAEEEMGPDLGEQEDATYTAALDTTEQASIDQTDLEGEAPWSSGIYEKVDEANSPKHFSDAPHSRDVLRSPSYESRREAALMNDDAGPQGSRLWVWLVLAVLVVVVLVGLLLFLQ